MPFPDVERVIYNENPLDRVICQLRFAPILKIDTEIPAEFQERIRIDYPNLSETADWSLVADPNKREGLPDDVVNRTLQVQIIIDELTIEVGRLADLSPGVEVEGVE